MSSSHRTSIEVKRLPIGAKKDITEPQAGRWLYWRAGLSRIKKDLIKAVQPGGRNSKKDIVDVPDKIRIMFAENFPNSAKISASVSRALRRNEDIQVNILATNPAVIDAVSEMCDADLLDQTTSRMGWAEIILRKILTLLFVWLMGCRQLQKRFAAENQINLFISRRQKIAAAKSIMRAIQYTGQFDKAIQKYRPHRIATTSINGCFARAPMSLAKKYGIPTYFIQHGLTYFESYEMRVLQDYAIVWGDYSREK